MASKQRIERLNSLLKEVISEVVRDDVRDPRLGSLITITSVDTSKDIQHAKVYISVIGTPEEKKKSLAAVQSGAGFIAVNASKKVSMRYFPSLSFRLDDSADKHVIVENILSKLKEEQKLRPVLDDETSE